MKSAVLFLSLPLMAACAPPPGPMPVEPYPPHTGGPPAPDQCGAAAHQWLVGRSHAEVPPAPPGRNRRVYPTGDALTMDYSPQRLNIEYDPRTHRVVRVWCG
jgi:hypothetical protein